MRSIGLNSYEHSGKVTSASMGRKKTGRWHVEKDQLLCRVRERPALEVLRGLDLRKESEAAARRVVAVGGRHRAVARPKVGPQRERGEVMRNLMLLTLALVTSTGSAHAQDVAAGERLKCQPCHDIGEGARETSWARSSTVSMAARPACSRDTTPAMPSRSPTSCGAS